MYIWYVSMCRYLQRSVASGIPRAEPEDNCEPLDICTGNQTALNSLIAEPPLEPPFFSLFKEELCRNVIHPLKVCSVVS